MKDVQALTNSNKQLELNPTQLDQIYGVPKNDTDVDSALGSEEANRKVEVESSLGSSKERNSMDSDSMESHLRLMGEINVSDSQKTDDVGFTFRDLYALGLVSQNKDLLLFDRQIQLTRNPERWLNDVELQMKSTVRMQLKNSVERFGY
jgi:hypothetical protein